MSKMTVKLGATGEFPKGKLNEDDEGELRFRVGALDGNVVIDFGTPVVWLTMPPDQAIEVAIAVINKAKSIQEREPK